MNKIILDICGGTGSWSKPYLENGYDVKVITLPDYDINDIDVQNWLISLKPHGILAAPPCTMFSLARNDKTAKEERDLRGGLQTVNSCLRVVQECYFDKFRKKDAYLQFWCLENPASGYLNRFLGNPYYVFNPCDHGDPYTKKTALWGMFNKPDKKPTKAILNNPVKFCNSKNWDKNIPDGYCEKTGYDKRKVMRSMTPYGFAKAFYEANP